MRSSQVLLILLLLASLCFPAYVYGDIYSQNLEKINKTMIRVEGSFSYALVTDRGNYSFFLQPGDYTIHASSFDEAGTLVLFCEEKIAVGDSDQRLDLVLKPADNLWYLPYLAALVLVGAVFVWANRYWGGRVPPAKDEQREAPVLKPPQSYVLDEDAKKVLSLLESFENRATQKDLKDALGFSDAKLSLILSELESMGKIKRFKRGRGNVVRKT